MHPSVVLKLFRLLRPAYKTFSLTCLCISGMGGREGAVQRCPNCRGTGMQVRVQQLGPGMMQQIQSICHECQGQGERIDPKHRCKTCNGRKVSTYRFLSLSK